ncbi:nucleolar protein 8-like isoform X3 [Lycorma delicatula]|uniref:nucleolar protein 8-like isoform X3 n=1 Tax=Lycorma delicatula TaxID=130591 RepID=UPI003F512ACD
MEKKRFFVGNLPHEIDDVIRSRFSKYGLKKLPRKKWLGKEITVEFAKESILNKLENERRAAKDNISGKTNDATKMPHSCFESNNGDLFENNEESVKIEDIKTSTLPKINFNSKSNSNILTKLENFSNVWKDCDEFSGRKITKFDDSSDFSTTVNERHENVFPKKIIGSKEKFNFLDSNKFSDIDKKNNGSESKFSRNFINADEKRLKSIKEMKKAIDQRKQTIKKALSSVDSGNLNKKIVFNDDDDDTDYDKSVDNLHKTEKVNHYDKKSKLFNDDSCDENEVLHSFDVKQQFEGDKGKKLFELQSRFGNDSRFYTDEKFYESDEEKNDNEKQDIERLEDFDEKEETINDEVKKQLKILQSIVGTEFSGQQKKQKLKHVTSATGVRYDPSVPEHEKFIVKPSSIDENEEDVKQKKSKKSKNKQKEEVKEQECVNKPSVSNETYYEVADELKKNI